MDAAVAIRFLGNMPQNSGINLRIGFARFFQGPLHGRSEVISNVAVFVPFGFFLAEFLATMKRYGAWRRIGLATLAGFGLSLCIECLQLVLKVGYFEVMDLVLNTVGAFVGGSISAVGRTVFGLTDNHANP